jgi:Holliday junction resolvasome RuvABC endonuclease subunit
MTTAQLVWFRLYDGRMITRTLTIDPGTRDLGWAMFEIDSRSKTATLLDSGVISINARREKDWINRCDLMTDHLVDLAQAQRAERCIIEMPQTFSGKRGRVARNTGSVAKLTGLVMSLRLAMLYEGVDVTLVTVRKWKGSLPKRVTQQRVRRYWSWSKSDHNEADAVGIGDWYVRRCLKYTPKS